jgi:hypothetical protein
MLHFVVDTLGMGLFLGLYAYATTIEPLFLPRDRGPGGPDRGLFVPGLAVAESLR